MQAFRKLRAYLPLLAVVLFCYALFHVITPGTNTSPQMDPASAQCTGDCVASDRRRIVMGNNFKIIRARDGNHIEILDSGLEEGPVIPTAKSVDDGGDDKNNGDGNKDDANSDYYDDDEEDDYAGDARFRGNGNVDDDYAEGDLDGDDSQRKSTLATSPYIDRPRPDRQVIQKVVKYIALYEREVVFTPTKVSPTPFSSCVYDRCKITFDYSKADVVVFFSRDLWTKPIKEFWPRLPSQRWLFQTIDPIVEEFGLNNDTIRSLFNWTSTYKHDSDVPVYMGKLIKNKAPLLDKEFYAEIFRRKTRLAAWFVSHCRTWSRREDYVERMATVAPVDIFGKCGTFKCGNGREDRNKADHDNCNPKLTREYKFYLSFENSFCTEYVTEKFFKMFVGVHVIPVVRGDLDYNSLLPKGTFVNADDFATPEALMEYLVELGQDEERYTNMLREKDRWRNSINAENKFYCRLCEKVQTDNERSRIEDIHRHLRRNPDECYVPKDLGDAYKDWTLDDLREESGQFHVHIRNGG